MSDIEKKKERIKKLLAFAAGNHNSEEEAANAMRMAAGLATSIGIELDSLRSKDAPIPKAVLKSSLTSLKVYESYCAEAAGVLYGCECSAPNFGKHGYWFVGREENIELAEQTMLWLVQQVEALYKIALPRGLSKRDRAEFRGSFKDACGQRLYHRAYDLMRKMKTDEQTAQATTGSNALVVAGHFKQLQSEVEAYWEEKYYAPARKRAEEAQEKRQNMLAAMTEAERVKFLEKEAKEQAKEDAKPYRLRKGRSMKIGFGTQAGREAGDRVQLRQEIK